MKIIAFILSLLLCFTMVGCVVKQTVKTTPKTSTTTVSTTTTTSTSNSEQGGSDVNPDNPNGNGSNNQNNRDGYVIYINLDGFGKYYYDIAKSRNLVPTLQSILGEGVVFTNLKTLSPSITNPCQAMIVSGASSSKTGNVYRYYDKTLNVVIQQGRENNADTIYDSVIRNNVKSATIQHFPAESVFSITNKNALYIKTPSGVVSNAMARFDQAIKLIKKETITNDTTLVTLDEIPRFISIYCDDLDALGHNESAYDTFSVATSESERVDNVVTRLAQIDAKLAELIQACKDAGIYDKTTFFLTTDHGMQGFGADTTLGTWTSKYSKTKWPELKEKLAEIDSSYVFEYVAPNASPKSGTTVIGCGSGLQMPLTFKEAHTEAQLQEIKAELLKEYYIADVLTRTELAKLGFWMGANVDLLVIPAERYHFHGRDNSSMYYAVRGQHDTISENATHIYGAIWGAGIKNLGEFDGEYYNTSFGSTMAYMLGVDLKNANASVIYDILESED